MRRVDRSSVAPPAVLTAEGSAGRAELARVRAHMASPDTRAKAFAFSAYSDDGVKFALHALFHGKCAYCESYYYAQAPVDVEHYRPKGKVADAPDHPGYWWIAMAWDNLLPSCVDCNRRRFQQVPPRPEGLEALFLAPAPEKGGVKLGKQDLFPVAGTRAAAETDMLAAEEPLLLDPTRDDPAQHLAYHFGGGEPLALILPVVGADGPSAKGLASIHVYGLNRLGLVQDRTRVLRKLQFLAHLIDALDEIAEDLANRRTSRTQKAKDARLVAHLGLLTDQILAEIRHMAEDDQPFCSLVRAWTKTLDP